MATVVTEAAMQSGSLITARLCAEQGKQVFVVPGLINNPQAEGCHHLIREGATLIYHPDQILEDLNTQDGVALPSQFGHGQSIFTDHKTPSVEMPIAKSQTVSQVRSQADSLPVSQPAIDIAEHLQGVYQALTDAMQDLDALMLATKMSAGELLAALLELQMLGVVVHQGGFYAKSHSN